MRIYIGIDWGGSFVKAGFVDGTGRVIRSLISPSREFTDKSRFFSFIKEVAGQCPGTAAGIGIGAPGIVDPGRGLIYYLPNVPGWRNYRLAREIEKRTGLPAAVDNDANVFALAESRLGAAKGCDNALFLTLGTGLGGAVMIGGRIVHGQTSAGEVGHFPITVTEGRRCGCGGRGCVETFVGNRYLIEMYNGLQKSKKKKTDEVKVIYEKALAGEPQALKVWEYFSLGLGTFLSGMVNVFNPQVIVFGGGVSGAMKVFKPMLRRVMKERAMWPQLRGLKLVQARVREPGITGAALLARENRRTSAALRRETSAPCGR